MIDSKALMRLLLTLLVWLSNAPVDAQEAAKIWDKSAALYSKVRTLQIQFETTSWLESAPQKRSKVHQSLFFERPSRWRLQMAPAKISFVVDGKTLFAPDLEERFSVLAATYPDRLNKELFQAGGYAGILLEGLLHNNTLPQGKGVQVLALPARIIEGRTVRGVRIRGASLSIAPDTTLWFGTDGKLQRSQMRMQIEKQIVVMQSRVREQHLNGLLPANLFQAPPPFQSDVFEPQAVELLDRAAKFYGGLKSLRLRIRTLDQTPKARYLTRDSQSATSTLEFRRPDQLRLERTRDKIDEDSSSFRALLRDGKTLWTQDESDASDTWTRSRIDAYDARNFAADWAKNTPSLSYGTGKVLWHLLHGRSPAPRDSERETAKAWFEVRFLGAHPREKDWRGVRIRESNQKIWKSVDEETLWFEVSDPQKPVLKRVQFRSDQEKDISPMQNIEETMEQSDFNPTLPDARFRPASGAQVLSGD